MYNRIMRVYAIRKRGRGQILIVDNLKDIGEYIKNDLEETGDWVTVEVQEMNQEEFESFREFGGL